MNERDHDTIRDWLYQIKQICQEQIDELEKRVATLENELETRKANEELMSDH